MKVLRFVLLVVAAVAFALPAAAGVFTAIPNPDAAYLAGTTYLDISYVPLFSDVTSITDGTLTVGFSGAMNRVEAPGAGWASWSVAPDSQRQDGEILPVLYSNGATSALFSLSTGMQIFGFEAEPNPFGVFSMTATFFDENMNVLGSITRGVDGNAGARLFAASVDPIWFVEFSSDVDFAVGAFRYAQGEGVPEPGTIALIGAGLLGLGLFRRKLA